MTHLLDTCTCSCLIRGHPGCHHRMRRCSPSLLGIAAVTWAEGLYGCERSPRGHILRQMWTVLTRDWHVVPFDRACAEHYARLRADLERRGYVIGDRDMMIAATALAHDLVLVTDNDSEFSGILGLRVENWCDGPAGGG